MNDDNVITVDFRGLRPKVTPELGHLPITTLIDMIEQWDNENTQTVEWKARGRELLATTFTRAQSPMLKAACMYFWRKVS